MSDFVFTAKQEQKYSAPPILSWLIAISCTCIMFLIIISTDSFATAAHFSAIRDRLNTIIYTNNSPELILDDLYIKSAPEKHLSKIKKAVNIYNSIRYDLHERALILLNETSFEICPSLDQLRETLIHLIILRQNKKETSKTGMPIPEDEKEKKLKNEALELAKDLLSRESSPQINPISELAYKTIKDKF